MPTKQEDFVVSRKTVKTTPFSYTIKIPLHTWYSTIIFLFDLILFKNFKNYLSQ